jgi:mannose-6-phosphate isomerase
MRLHVQVHPTSAFAQKYMNAPYGKLEVYYVLSVREGCEGYVRMGFQHSPGRERWREIVEQQDIAAMDACFEKIPVQKGDVWIVPGGLPHAIGEGVLMIEIMEPSDLVVRCEFEREGVVLPPNSRYMGRDLDFCLDVFDYKSYSPSEAKKSSLLTPKPLIHRDGWQYDQLISPKDTSCFEVFRLRASCTGELDGQDRCSLFIQVEGQAELRVGNEFIALNEGDACFVAVTKEPIIYTPQSPACELICTKPIIPSETHHE